MPLYAQAIYRPLWGLSRDIIIGLPISAFMLCSAVSLPLAGALSDVAGRRKCFLIGALISLVGMIGCSRSTDIGWLILLRGMVGFGFGIAYMGAQGYIIDTTDDAHRGEGMAMFLSALYAGSLCGTAIGGLIADRTGFEPLFLVGAAMVLAAMVFLYCFVPETQTAAAEDPQAGRTRFRRSLGQALPGPKQFLRLLGDREFLALVLLQAIPSKIGLIGLVFYSAPLMLKALGNSQSDIARGMIGYSLMMVLFAHLASRWSDRGNRGMTSMVAGGVLSGLVLIPFYWWQNTAVIMGAILGLGLAHIFVIPSQGKMASQLRQVRAVGVGSGMGLYTQCERLGNVLAPLVVGGLVAVFGFAPALSLLGGYIVVSSLLYGWLQGTPGTYPDADRSTGSPK
jgi:MFS family permease